MRVLLIVHGYPPHAIGGTEIYTRDLAVALAATPGAEVFVLTRDADPRRPDGAVRDEHQGPIRVVWINNTFAACRSFEETYRHPAVLRAADAIIRDIQPQVAHVHHLTCLSTDLVTRLRGSGVPVVLTLHDYWLLCHRGQLVGRDYARCDGPVTGACARCIPAEVAWGASAYQAAALLRRLPGSRSFTAAAATLMNNRSPAAGLEASIARFRHMRDVAGACDLIFAPSATIAGRFAACRMPMARVEPWTLGIGIATAARVPRRPDEPLRLGFVGAFLPTKAPHLLVEAAARLPAGRVTVDLAGTAGDYHGDRSYQSRLGPWLSHAVVRRHGAIPHAEMPAHLARLDVLVLPSIWLENSPLVIKEAFAAGLPVVVSDLGGMAELVRHDVDGLRFPAGDVDALAACLRRLVDEPDLVARLRAGIRAPATIAEDAARTLRRYQALVTPSTERPASPRRRGDGVAAVILNYRAPEQTALAVRSLQSSFTPPSSILVVDNSAGDGSGRLSPLLQDTGRQPVRVIDASWNLGFAGGCNVGIDTALRTGAAYVLLVNSDAVLAPDAIAHLLDAAAAYPEAGVLGALIVSREEPDWIVSAGIEYSRTTGRMRNRLTRRPLNDAPRVPFAVAAVTGCVMLIRREVFEAAGLFDEAYFFSFEDVDFCVRAGAAGFSVLCVPEARAWHEGGRSIGRRSPRRIYFATRNHLRLAGSLEQRRIRRGWRAIFIVALNTAYVLTSADAPLWSGLAAVIRGGWHHLLGRYGADPAA